jgi:hypothetical protein
LTHGENLNLSHLAAERAKTDKAIAAFAALAERARRPGGRAGEALVAAANELKLGRIPNCAVQPEM